MRKFSKFLSIFVFLALSFILVACEKIEISFEKEEVTIVAGNQLELELIKSSDELELVWETNDESVVTVDNGTITGVNPGQADVTVTVAGKDIMATIRVIVNPVSINFSETSVTLVIDEEKTLTPIVTPQQAMTYNWTSSDSAIVSVVNGKIKGIAVGTATVTATGKGGTATVSVTVNLPTPAKVTITNSPTNPKVGDEVQLNVTVLPDKAPKDVIWTSSDTAIAMVNSTGRVIFTGIGSADITARSKTAATVLNKVTINVGAPDPQTIEITPKFNIEKLIITQTMEFVANVSPDLAIQDVNWSTSDTTIATITEEGLVTAVKVGNVKIIATSAFDPLVYGEFDLQVVLPDPTAVVVTAPETVIQIDEQLQLTSTVYPALASQTVTYSSSDTSVLTVDENGKVTGVAAGYAVVTVYSVLSEIHQMYNVKVVEKIGTLTHDNVYVDSTLSTKERYEKILVNDIEYIVGINAFADFSKVTVKAGSTVLVAKGTYLENLTITANNVTVIGPNKDINPNTQTRTDEAIMTGKILVNNAVEGININGMAFTGAGAVQALGTSKNVIFSYNNVYETTPTTVVWTASRVYTLVGFFTFWKQSTPVENILVENNKFNKVSSTNLMIGNYTTLTIRGNVFTNFDRDAIRIDGGYNYGTALIENNTFANDVLGGYNGIYFRTIGAAKDSTNPNIVTVRNNTFKNIGNVANEIATDMSGAISSNGYQEYGATISVTNNTFETCSNYILLRNNATAANHAAYQWNAKVNYNIFKGLPSGYYHKNRTGTDTEITNPALTNFDLNFFGDAFGQGVQLDDAKFNYVGSLNYTFNAIEDMTAIYVDASLAGSTDNQEVTVRGQKLIFGQKAFASIQTALNTAIEGSIIIVLPGTYSETVTITNKVSLKTLNSDINPTINDASFKAVNTATTINGTWYVNASDITIKGFTFTGAARIRNYDVSGGNWSGFLFQNNYAYNTDNASLDWKKEAYSTNGVTEASDTTTPGFINLAAYQLVQNDYKFINNKFSFVHDTNIYLLGINGVTIKGNIFENGARDAIRFDSQNTQGVLNIFDNSISNFTHNGIYLRSYGAQANSTTIVNILNNDFKNLASEGQTVVLNTTRISAIATSDFAQQGNVTFNIRFNNFENNYNYISLRDFVTDATIWDAGTYTWKAYIEYNSFIDTDSVNFYYQNLLSSTDSNVTNTGDAVINHNFYGTDAQTKATITIGQFDYHNSSLSNLVIYDSVALLEEGILLALTPATIEITSPSTVLQGLQTMQVSAKVLPITASQAVVWSTSDPTIAIVNADGVVTGLKPGLVKIVATSKDNSTVFAEYELTVEGIIAPSIIVDESLTSAEELSTFIENNITYYVGLNAFASLDLAIAVINNGSTVVFKSGTYTGTYIINKNDVSFVGPNKDLNGNFENRVSEAYLNAKITLATGIKNFSINGFFINHHASNTFITGEAAGLQEGFIFKNNVVDGGAGDGSMGFIVFKQANATTKTIGFVIENNRFFSFGSDRVIRIAYTENLIIRNNTFTDAGSDAIRLNDNSGGVLGTTLITNNTFTNIGQFGIFIGASNNSSLEITNNKFEKTGFSLGGGAISIRNTTIQSTTTTMNIANNEFANSKDYDIRLDHTAIEASKLIITVNNNTFKTIPASYYYSNNNATAFAKTYFYNNTIYAADGVTLVEPSTIPTMVKNVILNAPPQS